MYLAGANGSTTTLVSTIATGGNDFNYRYTYDSLNRITKITDAFWGTQAVTYAYDALGRLTRENDRIANKTYVYTYDKYGNIQARKTYAYTAPTGTLGAVQSTVTYSYDAEKWRDQLTNYNGSAITYDSIGNALTWRDGMAFTWQAGRQMYSTTATSGTVYRYRYNDDGIRYQKWGGGVTTSYYLDGSTILAESRTDGTKIVYMHDENGNYVGFNYKDEDYYYAFNAQGDVVGIYNVDGEVVARYRYDAWGKVISVTNASLSAITDATHVANVNPIRYRGYYYDVETGLYYLNSRYYDPTVGRFVNADGINIDNTNIHAYNLYSYCYNDPINNVDPTGYIVGIDDITVITIVGFMVLLSGIAAISAASADYDSSGFDLSWQKPFQNTQVALMLFIATVSPSVVDSPALNSTAYSSTKSTSKSDPIDIAKTIPKTDNRTYQYWSASFVGNKVIVGRGLSYLEAQLEISLGNNIMCANQFGAFSILFNMGYRNMVGPERSGGKNGDGFYWHYHPNRQSKVHVWYYS